MVSMIRDIDVESIESLKTIFQLKEEDRAGWVLRGIEKPESVADHSWGTAILSLLFHNDLNLVKCLKMSLVHDIIEAETGDIARSQINDEKDLKKKLEKEKKALKKLKAELDPEIMEIYIEYKEKKTKEALFVKDMDLIDMCLQALIYQEKKDLGNSNKPINGDLDEFFSTAESEISTKTGIKLYKEIKKKYNELK
ncbi:HD domain-containing protein [Methanonatronarchaeum sp. AMET-Sl]|uniref:HD domain-containing protein n=1 Tax=Methanonatronarchaeum sp. AMET-Sl TaxID=3037654 RepID=UPI00244DD358|nr:HD domain-containing protein [Methanonatronarchaeum sp. AMET-Sl]WGI17244.1 HD domain-containing protein [Methanonatronarchaeum sp. AMET-Sl]